MSGLPLGEWITPIHLRPCKGLIIVDGMGSLLHTIAVRFFVLVNGKIFVKKFGCFKLNSYLCPRFKVYSLMNHGHLFFSSRSARDG